MRIGIGMGLGFGGQVLSSSAPWTPADLGADLSLWLDAEDTASITLNGSNVAQWDDKSGNDRHVSQGSASAQPEFAATGLNSKPTLRFNSPTQGRHLLSSVNFPSMTGGVSAIVVAQVDTVDNWNGYVGVGALVANTSNFEFYRQVGGNSGNLVISANRDQPGGNLNFRFRNNVDTPPVQGSPHIATTVISGATGLAGFMSVNGGGNLPLGGGTEHPTGTFIPQGTGIIRVGVGFFSGDIAASAMRGRISEIVMSASPWATTDRQRLEGYLAWKWGLVANLPGTHPYRYTPPTTDEPAWDADALSYIGRVQNADAQALELNVRIAIDNFVKGCKADGIWDAIKASAILAGARTLEGALQPLVGSAPTNFNFISGDYNRTTGLVGDGATKYLNSNRNNNADPQDSRHVSVFVTVGETRNATRCALASSDPLSGAGTTELLSTPAARFFRINRSSSSFPVVTTASIYGLLAAERNNAANCSARFNNNTQTLSDTSSAPTANQIDLYRRGTASYSDARLAFYSIGESLDLAQLDARVTALINAYAAAIP